MNKKSLEDIAWRMGIGALIGAGLLFTGILIYSCTKTLLEVESDLYKRSQQSERDYSILSIINPNQNTQNTN